MRPPAPPDPWEPVNARVVKGLRAWWLGDPVLREARRWRVFYRASREVLAARALERLRAILVHARDTVPFHAARMAAAGFVPERMTSPAEIAGIPPLTRRDVVAHGPALFSNAFARGELLEVMTGGTTSKPMPFFQDRGSWAEKDGQALVLRERMGWRYGERCAFLWGAAVDLPPGVRGRLGRVRDALKHRFVNRSLYLPASDLSDASLDRAIAALGRFRPRWMQAYPSAADLLARRVLARGLSLHVPHVLLTAEPVLPSMRERIHQALGSEVVSFYGSRECAWIASECAAEHRAHVNTAGVFLEALDDGRLLVTDLCNRGMPFVRYEIGDRGWLDPEPCPCGDPRPVLGGLEGRILDVIVLPSGRRVPGVIPDVRGIQRPALGIEEGKMVQQDLHSLDVYWIAGPNYQPDHLEVYRRFLDDIFFHELEIRMHQVERIEPEPNGKVRYCVSFVAQAEAQR